MAAGVVGAGATTGTTQLPIANMTRALSDGGYMLDTATASYVGSVNGASIRIGTSGVYTYPVTETVTPSTAYGTLTCGSAGLPQLQILATGTITSGSTAMTSVSAGGVVLVGMGVSGVGIRSGTTVSAVSGSTITLSLPANPNPSPSTPQVILQGTSASSAAEGVTCTVTGIAGTNAGGFVPGIAAIAQGQAEQALITSVGTISGGSQTVVLTYRNPHPNTDGGVTGMLFQGGTQGTFLSEDWRMAQYPIRTPFTIFGAIDSHTLVCGITVIGAQTQCPNSYTNLPPISIVSLTQSGTTVTAGVPANTDYMNLRATANV